VDTSYALTAPTSLLDSSELHLMTSIMLRATSLEDTSFKMKKRNTTITMIRRKKRKRKRKKRMIGTLVAFLIDQDSPHYVKYYMMYVCKSSCFECCNV
jgi:hypothetical protein